MLRWLWLSVLIIVADQATKIVVSSYLEMFQPVAIIPFLNLMLAHNTGAAFSFLSEAGGWQRWFFSILAFVVSVFIFFWIKKLKPHEKMDAIALSLVLGGAIGNLIDRVRLGYVVDFIDVYVGASHWPAFNFADSAIVIGAVLLLVLSFKSDKK